MSASRARLPRRRSFGSVAEAEKLAQRVLPPFLFHRLMWGYGRNLTCVDNMAAFDEVGFAPCAAVMSAPPRLGTTILGRPVDLPVIVAPTGFPRLFHAGGEPAVARATAAAGTIDICSFGSGHDIEEIARVGQGRRWQQLYWSYGREGAEEVMSRAAAAGYEALVVTMDIAVHTNPDMEISSITPDVVLRFGPQALSRPAWMLRFAKDRTFREYRRRRVLSGGAPGDRLSPTWDEIEWIRANWQGPLVLKGVLSVDDARRAADVGADAVVVSNHGGRGLDTQPATLRVLPSVVDAVGDQLEVYLDSGVREGSDVVKALALGARAVLIGKAYLFGLAVGGEDGVRRILEIFADEISSLMRLLGRETIADIDGSCLLHDWNRTHPQTPPKD